MKKGKIVEYIEKQKIIAAVILEEKKGRFRLLTENDREINFSEKRLSHISDTELDISSSRDFLVKQLKKITRNRQELSGKIDIKELWEVLHEEEEEIDVPTMANFCFDPPLTCNHEAAVLRAFFRDRLYFKFGKEGLKPYTPEQLEEKQRQIEAEHRRYRLIEKGGEWIRKLLAHNGGNGLEEADPDVIRILKWYYLLEKESRTSQTAKAMLEKGGLKSPDQIFQVLVKAGIWDEDENTDLILLGIETDFPAVIKTDAENLTARMDELLDDPKREDMTGLSIITIDGQSTLDFDDAVSLEKNENGYTLCVHIVDVACYIKAGDRIDEDAKTRGSSIYMPDRKISMIPPQLSEDLCSLKQGEARPCITTRVRMNRFFEILEWEIVPSLIRVQKQMTYFEANLLNGKEEPITTLYKMATALREKRLKNGAIQITLPELNIWIEADKEIKITRIDRENPSRMLISEFMILANSLMAEFLRVNDTPAVFRSQAEPNERLFRDIETSVFLNIMQRKRLSRAVITPEPEYHAGLGVSAYVTATSPIRRYYDLLTQRQIRSVLGYEKAAGREAIEETLQLLAPPVGNAGKIQAKRRKYWILKHLETLKGETFQAIVLEAHKEFYMVLIKDLMFEWKLPSGGLKLKPGDLVGVTIQHANARRDQLSLFAQPGFNV